MARRGWTARSLGGLLVVLALAGCGAPAAPAASAPFAAGPSAGATASGGAIARPSATAASGAITDATSAPRSTTGDPVVDGRRADLEQLLDELVGVHPNPFLDEGQAAFRTRLEALSARAGDLSDAGFLVGVMELMGHRDRDGHSGAWAMAQTGKLHAWPVWLWDFPDGLRIVAAGEPHADLLGARVTAVGGTPVADAWDVVAPLVPRDNPSTLRANLPIYLTVPEVLAERGVQRPEAPSLTLEMLDGTIREVELDALPIEAFRDWIFGVYGGYPVEFPPDPDGMAIQRHRPAIIWTEPLASGGTYVGYNEVRSSKGPEGTTTGDVASTIVAATSAEDAAPWIVDLRNNGGGDNTTFGPLRSAIERQADAHPGTIALIAGRDTFSAAGNFVTDLMTGPSADAMTLVGEPPGGGPNIYGDVRVVTLDSTGIVVLISTRYHERAPGHDELELTPTIPVELTWADVAAGRDRVLDAAIEATHR